MNRWLAALGALALAGCASTAPKAYDNHSGYPVVTLLPTAASGNLTLAEAQAIQLDGFFFETAKGRTTLPARLVLREASGYIQGSLVMPDGRDINVAIHREGEEYAMHLTAEPDDDITRWGFAIRATPDEYFTGAMERVVDGPQLASWSPGIAAALNLRGQKVEMLIKPTPSLYAPFYLSSRNYAVYVQSKRPGYFDFCASDPARVWIEFEGRSLHVTVYTANHPALLVREHALDAGPPFLPPKWMYGTWRWRDENTQRDTYYDGTPVTGPFNSEAMEDVLLMKAYGIPLSILWIDRPWGPGPAGYDDFEIDTDRMPNFAAMVQWLKQQDIKTIMWIGPFFNGKMAEVALEKHYNLPGQPPQEVGENYPLVDFTNPAAKAYWQNGVAKLIKLGVVGFKMDRSEENIPESGNYSTMDGLPIRENRMLYPVLYVQAAYEVARHYLGDNFVCMPRAGYTGSSPYAVFWGGDVLGTQEGLRAEIIAVQRAAVMGYPNWGSDTCGYTQPRGDPLNHEVCAHWLAFSCFTPIMEVGPTRNVAFWDAPRAPSYDADLIALWRLYARLHTRLADYSYHYAQVAHDTGLPIVRPLFLVDPQAPAAWSNWWTYEYGPDLVVSPIWKNGQRTQEVYLPSGPQWRDAWHPDRIYDGGQTITVTVDLYQVPLFVRVGGKVDVGDLNQEWKDAQAAAAQKPDLAALDAQVAEWFKNYQAAGK